MADTGFVVITGVTLGSTGGSMRLRPGSVIHDPVVLSDALKIGAVLAPITNPIIAKASERALAMYARGVWEDEGPSEIMLQAYSAFVDSDNGSGPILVRFDYTTPSSVLSAVTANQLVEQAFVTIFVPFDPGVTISFGTVLLPSLILSSSETVPNVLGQYEAREARLIAAPEMLMLTFGGAPATMGSGVLSYLLRT